MTEEKRFEPDFDKPLFEITIAVYENCSMMNVSNTEGEKRPTYHEVIGALETNKQNLIWSQREHNREAFEQHKSKSND